MKCPWYFDVGVAAHCELEMGHTGRHILGAKDKALGKNYIDWASGDDGAYYNTDPRTWEVT